VETALVVALISGAVALASATIAAVAQLRVKRLEQAAREEESRSEARIVLDRYRGPLLDAAWDLGDRLDNIIDRGFLSRYRGTERESVALRSTLFRAAQYFGWAEILRREIQLLRFEGAGDTRRSAYFLSLVVRRFATDWYDSADAFEQAKRWYANRDLRELSSGHLMLWQEEQRGIGERMIEANGSPTCVGYATFVEQYERRFAPLLGGFESHLDRPGVEDSLRLLEVRDALARLVHQLDEEQRYVVGQVGYSSWLDSAHDSPCWDAYEHPDAAEAGAQPARS
jgi:hypothetical protein